MLISACLFECENIPNLSQAREVCCDVLEVYIVGEHDSGWK